MKKEEFFYHYCSCDSFQKIIESKSLWMHSLAMCNDPSEITYAVDYIKNYFKELGFTKNLAAIAGGPKKEVLYASSLSNKKDDLGQWIAYGDSGFGFSIGFEREAFPKKEYDLLGYSFDEQTLPVFFNKIIYGRISKNVLLSKVFPNDNIEPDVVLKKVLNLLPILKNEAFAAEGEYRLLYNSTLGKPFKNQCKFGYRVCRYGLTSYYVFPLMGNVIKQVTIGPKNNSLAVLVKKFLENAGYTGVDISYSQVPYR